MRNQQLLIDKIIHYSLGNLKYTYILILITLVYIVLESILWYIYIIYVYIIVV